MDVMGGCCGQTFLAVSPDGRKKLFQGPETLGEVLGTVGCFDVTPFTGSIHHSFHNLSESRESCGFPEHTHTHTHTHTHSTTATGYTNRTNVGP